jgi:hypothetical protein
MSKGKDSKTYQIDLNKQNGLVRLTIEESDINTKNLKLKIFDNC